MVTKVGSAGQVLDSVIQYPKENSVSEQSESSKNEAATQREMDARLRHRPDRIIKASEMADVQSTHRANSLNKAAQQAVNPAPAVTQMSSLDPESEIEGRNPQSLELSQEAIKITVDDVNKKLVDQGASIAFSYHEKTGRYSFKVLDKETGKVLKEVPPEKSLDMVAKMFEMVGIIVDEKL